MMSWVVAVMMMMVVVVMVMKCVAESTLLALFLGWF